MLHELKHEANQLGANGIVGIDLDYSEISGGGKSMLLIVATGTAVVIRNLKIMKHFLLFILITTCNKNIDSNSNYVKDLEKKK